MLAKLLSWYRMVPRHPRQISRRSRGKVIFVVLLILLPILLFGIYLHFHKISYFFRPIWDKPPPKFKHLPHYFAENVSMDNLCRLHGWTLRPEPRRVFDGIIFSNELDLLEIRWRELYPYVTKFVILEANTTFTGLPKPLYFSDHRERFAFAEDKILHGVFPGRIASLGSHEDPFKLEEQQRIAMNSLLHAAGVFEDDLLIMSDTDEIPAITLLNCFSGVTGCLPCCILNLDITCTPLSSLLTIVAGAPVFTFTTGGRDIDIPAKQMLYFLMQGGIVAFASGICKILYSK